MKLEARSLRLIKLDEDGLPTGASVTFPDEFPSGPWVRLGWRTPVPEALSLRSVWLIFGAATARSVRDEQAALKVWEGEGGAL